MIQKLQEMIASNAYLGHIFGEPSKVIELEEPKLEAEGDEIDISENASGKTADEATKKVEPAQKCDWTIFTQVIDRISFLGLIVAFAYIHK